MVAKNRILVSIVPAVILKLLSSEAYEFTGDELLVLEALRRSDNSLREASAEQIAEYLQRYSPIQLQGIIINVKGIFHELKFVEAENIDGDCVTADVFELTNHPGADVRLTNSETGETYDIQLKATSSTAYVGEHQSQYPDIELLTTSEVASKILGVNSSGFSNAEMTESVAETMEELSRESHYVESSAQTSGLISAALNVKSVLSGQQKTSTAAIKTLEDIGIAGASAAIIEIIVG